MIRTILAAGFAITSVHAASPTVEAKDGNIILHLATGEAKTITTSGKDATPVLSPDGKWIVFARSVPGQSQQYDLVFHPIMPGRTYVVKSQTSFSDGGWTGLGSSTTSNAGNIRTVRHLNATESKRFYRVEITVD